MCNYCHLNGAVGFYQLLANCIVSSSVCVYICFLSFFSSSWGRFFLFFLSISPWFCLLYQFCDGFKVFVQIKSFIYRWNCQICSTSRMTTVFTSLTLQIEKREFCENTKILKLNFFRENLFTLGKYLHLHCDIQEKSSCDSCILSFPFPSFSLFDNSISFFFLGIWWQHWIQDTIHTQMPVKRECHINSAASRQKNYCKYCILKQKKATPTAANSLQFLLMHLWNLKLFCSLLPFSTHPHSATAFNSFSQLV